MIILTPEEAAFVRGISPTDGRAALEPRALQNGDLALSESVLADPDNADVAAFLATLPTDPAPTYATSAEADALDYPTWREAGIRGRRQGSEYTPEWVNAYLGPWLGGSGTLNRFVRLPLTLAEGIADGRIPSNAIDYSTGNGGGSFASFDAWVAAGKAQDKPLALGVNLAPSSIAANHLARGIYGYGVQMPKITHPLSGGQRTSARLTSYIFDAKIRGIEFVNAGYVIRQAREIVPLIQNGAALGGGTNYAASNDVNWLNARGITGNPATHTARVAELHLSGSGNLNQIHIKRRPPQSPALFATVWDGLGGNVSISVASPAVVTKVGHGKVANERVQFYNLTGNLPIGLDEGRLYFVRNATANTFELSLTEGPGGALINTTAAGTGQPRILDFAWNPAMEGYVDGVNDNFPILLSAPVVGATLASVAAAINAGTATHHYTAHIDTPGNRLLLSVDQPYIEPLRLEFETTGTLAVGHECCMPGIDISCCRFTDCNAVIGGYTETVAHGAIHFLFNEGPGGWSGVNLGGLRRTYTRVACNRWYGANAARPAAAGRTSSRMPSGGGTSGWGAFCLLGSNTYWLNFFGYSDERFENNTCEETESGQTSLDQDAAVAFDIRLTSADAVLDNRGVAVRQCYIGWNKIKNYRNLFGHEDSNAIYGKIRGGLIENNWVENTGSGWASVANNGAECAGIIIKEAYSTDDMPELIVRGNTFRNMPWGIPQLKIDFQRNATIEYNDFEGWINKKAGPVGVGYNTDASSAGVIRINGVVRAIKIRSNRFKNIDIGPATNLIVNFHNLDASTDLQPSQWELSNMDVWNDGTALYPAYTGDLNTWRLNFGGPGHPDPDHGGIAGPTAFLATWTLGRLRTLDAAGNPVGLASIQYTNTGQTDADNGNAPDRPFSGYNPT